MIASNLARSDGSEKIMVAPGGNAARPSAQKSEDPILKACPDYLDLKARSLLDKFGIGGHKPGSGSAAALQGLLGCELTRTVAQLTSRKPKYKSVISEMTYVLKQTDTSRPQLEAAFQRDSEVFNSVHHLRLKRDKAKEQGDPKSSRSFADQERELMKDATVLPLEIAQLCLSIARLARLTFDKGFRAARGDSGTAMSSAIGGAESSLFVASLNLAMRFRDSDWAQSVRMDLADIQSSVLSERLHSVNRLHELGGLADSSDRTTISDSSQVEFAFS